MSVANQTSATIRRDVTAVRKQWPQYFSPAVTESGQPCEDCVKLGERCHRVDHRIIDDKTNLYVHPDPSQNRNSETQLEYRLTFYGKYVPDSSKDPRVVARKDDKDGGEDDGAKEKKGKKRPRSAASGPSVVERAAVAERATAVSAAAAAAALAAPAVKKDDEAEPPAVPRV